MWSNFSNDLDEVSTLSKKMHTMSEISRSKVEKFVATTLELDQVSLYGIEWSLNVHLTFSIIFRWIIDAFLSLLNMKKNITQQ